jgi:hypothetical protein
MSSGIRKPLFGLAALALLLLLAGCGVRTDCTNAKEFIESYSQAYRDGNAKAIMRMKAGTGILEKMAINDALKQQLLDYSREREEKELEQGLKDDDLWVRAWKNTRYSGEQDHGDHIHVDVEVDGVPSAVVLVRDGKYLRIHPRPSWFD